MGKKRNYGASEDSPDACFGAPGSPAAFAQGGLLSTRSGHDWVVEHNTLRHAKTIGLDMGDEGGADPEGRQPLPLFIGNHTIRWNRIVDNGGKGITVK